MVSKKETEDFVASYKDETAPEFAESKILPIIDLF